MEEKTCHSQAAEAALAGIPADCEVYGLFSDLLPPARVQEGGELHLARARQEQVPDFRFLLPTPEGPQSCLAELKLVVQARLGSRGALQAKVSTGEQTAENSL